MLLRLPRMLPRCLLTYIHESPMNAIIHLPARFVGTVAHSFCRCGYGAMQHREAPAEHSEHLHLVNFALPYPLGSLTSQDSRCRRQVGLPPLPDRHRLLRALVALAIPTYAHNEVLALNFRINLTTLAFFARICLIICTFTRFGNDQLVLFQQNMPFVLSAQNQIPPGRITLPTGGP